MENSNKTKKDREIELDSFEVLACKSNELQPFLNIFSYKEENLSKSLLGELFGAIEVLDHSEQSAYLPNLIAQVMKKEFFINAERDTETAFENSLKKANIALSDLTRHEVVNWVGKIHAVIGAIKDDSFFFTQAGGGKIVLLRNGTISDISRGLDDNSSDHPMKTFVNVSTGKLLDNDKILFTTEGFFNSLSWEDLKRHAGAFNSNEFDNLIKSTLETEGECVGFVMVNAKEKTILPKAILPKTSSDTKRNFFGSEKVSVKQKNESASDKVDPKSPVAKPESEQKKARTEVPYITISEKHSDFPKEKPTGEVAKRKKEEKEKEKEKLSENKKELSPFEKQPELFIKEDEQLEMKEVEKKDKAENVKDILKDVLEKTKKVKNVKNDPVEKMKKMKEQGSSKATPSQNNFDHKGDSNKDPIKEGSLKIVSSGSFEKKIQPKTFASPQEKQPKSLNEKKEKAIVPASPIPPFPKNKTASGVPDNEPELSSSLEKRKKKIEQGVSDFFNTPKEKLPKKGPLAPVIVETQNKQEPSKRPKELLSLQSKKETLKEKKNLKALLPKKEHFAKGKAVLGSHLQKFSNEFTNLRQKAKSKELDFIEVIKSRYIFPTIIASVILILLLVTFVAKKDNGQLQKQIGIKEEGSAQQEDETYLKDKEVSVSVVGRMDSKIIDIAGYKKDLYVFSENNSFFRYDSNINEFGGVPMTDGIRDVKSMITMPSLNLIFFVSNDSVHSFSPVLERFDNHKIKMPADSKIIGADIHKAYSFLYVFDKSSGQIYRYPRTEGGFGDPKNWFKDNVSTEGVLDFVIDDGIRVLHEDGKIDQYYQTKLTSSFKIEAEPGAIPKKIFTDSETNFYYLLDKNHPRVLKVNKNGNSVVDQYWNRAFKDATNFFIHEDETGYVVSAQNEILQFKLR